MDGRHGGGEQLGEALEERLDGALDERAERLERVVQSVGDVWPMPRRRVDHDAGDAGAAAERELVKGVQNVERADGVRLRIRHPPCRGVGPDRLCR